MNFLDAAYQVLKDAGQPLHHAEIARRTIEKSLIAPKGQTPEAMMTSRRYVDTKRPNSRIALTSRGTFALAKRVQFELSPRSRSSSKLRRRHGIVVGSASITWASRQQEEQPHGYSPGS